MIDMIEIVWSPSAVRDVEEIYRYTSARNRRAARQVVKTILERVQRLPDHPEIGPVADDIEPVGRYRHLVLRPYRVIYRLEGTTLRILRCWDSRRNPADLRVVDLRVVSREETSE